MGSFLALVALSLVFPGCGRNGVEIIPEREERLFQRGKYRLEQNRPEEALTAFLGLIDARRVAPESHFEAAEIYLNHLQDPVAAIYHYRRYLEFLPDSPQAGVVRQRIETAQKDFARQLPAQPFQGALDRLDMMELLDNLREENTRLKRQLIASQDRIQNLERQMGIVASTPEAQRRTPQLEDARTRTGAPTSREEATGSTEGTYTVVSGDTLTRISRKVYGTESRWMDIYQANRDTLASPNALQVGQVLRIP